MVARWRAPLPDCTGLAQLYVGNADGLTIPDIHQAVRRRFSIQLRRLRTQGHHQEPVRVGRAYPLLVPAVDDGNELGGWRGAMSSVPLGTFTAWNWKSPELARLLHLVNGAFSPACENT